MSGAVPGKEPKPETPNEQPNKQATVQNADANTIAQFVTTIKNAEQQIGEHVVRALQHGNTVAVLTTVVVGPGGRQHVISAALDEQKTAQINELLKDATLDKEDEEFCMGFHCLIQPQKGAPSESPGETPSQPDIRADEKP